MAASSIRSSHLSSTNPSNGSGGTPALEQARPRVAQVFRYLQALDQLRNPIVRQVSEQVWTLPLDGLPLHPSVQLVASNVRGEESAQRAEFRTIATADSLADTAPQSLTDTTRSASSENETEDAILRVRRPELTSAPLPPPVIEDWVRGWEDAFGTPYHINISSDVQRPSEPRTSPSSTSSSETLSERFDARAERIEAWTQWQEQWNDWSRTERPARQAMRLYEQLYDLHARLAREGERFDLVLGDGVLNWRRVEGGIHHPLLLRRLELHFELEQNEFLLRDTDAPVEFYSALFRGLTDIPGPTIRTLRDEAKLPDVEPLGNESTDAYLTRVASRLSVHGEFCGTQRLKGEADHPRLVREAWIFVRNRTLGFSSALENVLASIEEGDNISPALWGVVGIEPPVRTIDDSKLAGSTLLDANEDESVLLSKLANAEQLAIARRLEEHGNVLVQGPPGTGKTHTISNLIGHLLAQGKTVLVTSHTTKALRVLRGQVVEPLRPLCVSVLDNDVEGRHQLEGAVNAIVERLSDSASELSRQGQVLSSQRTQFIRELQGTRAALLEARGGEYRDVVLNGETVSPSEAARIVAQGHDKHGWLPGPLTPSAPCPLSLLDLTALYASNTAFSAADEDELTLSLPDIAHLPTPEVFADLVEAERAFQGQDFGHGQAFWSSASAQSATSPQTPQSGAASVGSSLQSLRTRAEQVMQALQDTTEWKVAAIAAGQTGGAEREVWNTLIRAVEAVREKALAAREGLLSQGPELATNIDLDTQEAILKEICAHLQNGGNLGGMTLLLHRAWKPVIEGTRADGNKPTRKEQFEALLALVALTKERKQLAARWDRQMTPLGAPAASDLGQEIEVGAAQFLSMLRGYLDWYTNSWAPLEAEMKNLGLDWPRVLEQAPPIFSPHAELLRLRQSVVQTLPGLIEAQIARLRWTQVQNGVAEITKRLDAFGTERVAPVISALRAAFAARDTTAYANAISRLQELQGLREVQKQRQAWLETLAHVAPAWAGAIRYRQAPHDGNSVPGDVAAAWRWRQLSDELERRDAVSVPQLEARIEWLGQQVRSHTAQLIDRKAWAAQVNRTNVQQRQALMGWVQTMRKIGKGTGKRALKLSGEARRLMGECRDAVPVWIMPLARVVETFDPRHTRFDVVIIDEASQSDVMGLLAFFLGEQVVVVGDDQQVSPDAVGQKVEEVQHLIDEHLPGIPNANLYDGTYSVYDVAMSSFGGTICLREHFRCVPDIIRFSNYLSYDGAIKALRDASSVHLQPALVPYRVVGAETASNNVNEAEAQAITSLLVAATEQPEYADASFGVISMVGLPQAERIDWLLRAHLSPAEYEKRRIICGNAAHFQGDEREVMFISMVNAPREGGPLMMQERPGYRKRLNVAASRARDQMWVVHSLQHDVDLKAGDLRRRFLEHVYDPQGLARMHEAADAHVDSEFERQVLQRLIAQGYRVKSQWEVGAYRLDLVVEGVVKRLAVECDGDRFHGLDKLQDDMARQALLERLGWKFARIRGSAFFRNPDAAMQPVWEKLERLGIEKLGAESPDDTPAFPASELIERVKARAIELRQQWQES